MKYTPEQLEISPREVVTFDFGRHRVTKEPLRRLMYIGCNELAELEDMLGCSIGSVLSDPSQATRISLMIQVLWVGMKVFDTDLTKQEVGRTLSQELGGEGSKRIWEAITEALRKGVPGMFAKKEAAAEQPPLPAAETSPPSAPAEVNVVSC